MVGYIVFSNIDGNISSFYLEKYVQILYNTINLLNLLNEIPSKLLPQQTQYNKKVVRISFI